MLGCSRKYWHGAILDSVATAIKLTANRTWKAITPIIYLANQTYQKEISISPSDLQQ